MFARFAHNTVMPKVARIDAQYILDNIKRWIETEEVLTIMSPHGFMIAFQQPSFYSSEMFAAEFAWWVDPDFKGTGEGKALKEYFERWAKEHNCAVTWIGVSSAFTSANHTHDYLVKDGYIACETNHVKRI